MKSARLSAVITVLILPSLLGGCSGPASPAPTATPTPETFVTPTPAEPTSAATAPPTETPWFGNTPTPEQFVARARVIAEPCLRVRTAPEVGSVLGCLPTGTVVDVLDNGGAWWVVEQAGGIQGWVSSQWLEVIP